MDFGWILDGKGVKRPRVRLSRSEDMVSEPEARGIELIEWRIPHTATVHEEDGADIPPEGAYLGSKCLRGA